VQEVLSAVRVVKSFGREESEQQRFVDRSSQRVRPRVRLAVKEGKFGAAVAVTTALGTAAVLYVGVRSVMAGTLTLGGLLVAMTYVANVYAPLKTISKRVAGLQSDLVSAERAFSLLDEMPDPVDRPGAQRLERAAGAIELRDVTFGYEPSQPVLRRPALGNRDGSSPFVRSLSLRRSPLPCPLYVKHLPTRGRL
jgi:ATP-binding cassette, subfamily B, bacterial